MRQLRRLVEHLGRRRSVEALGRTVRHAGRVLLQRPGLAAVVVVSLGVGTGVNTAVFSWIQAVVLEPIPGVRHAGRFYLIEPRSDSGSFPGSSWLEYRDLRERLRGFRDLLAFRMLPLALGEVPLTERAFGLLVSGNYFAGLGLEPALGRLLDDDDASRPGAEPVVVVSHDFWQTRFAGDPGVLGRTVRVNDTALTIIGVTPRAFQGTVLGLNFDLWLPATLAPTLLAGSRELEERGVRGYTLMGRLQPGTSRAAAQSEVDAAMSELARLHPESNQSVQAEVLAFWRAPRGPQRLFARGLGILQAVMLLLLLAVCANTANLMLARASERQREAGIRRALGAGRWHVAGLLLTENLLLGLLGAGLGIAIAVWATNALRAAPLTGAFPIRFQTGIDAGTIAFAALLGVLSGLLFGLPPALQLALLDPQRALRAGSSVTARSRLRNVLMAVEAALALLVLLFAGLFWRSFSATRSVDPGFERAGVLLAAYDLTGRPDDEAAWRLFASRLLARLLALPAVEAAAIARSVPLDIHGLPQASFSLEGRARTDSSLDRTLANLVTPGYLRTMGIPLQAGADFAQLDETSAPPQVIVNEEFVRRYLPDVEPLGRRLDARGRSFVIIGVARDSRYESFDEAPAPIVYFSYRDLPAAGGEIHLRSRAGAEAMLAADVRRVVRELDPALPVYDVRTLGEHIERNLFLRRIPARMFVVLGPLLLLVAAIGIYAVVAYTVARRRAEIGLRLALGAPARRVVGEIVLGSLRTVALGAFAGWLLAWVVKLHLRGGGPSDLAVFTLVPALLLLVATVASWLPARRASRIDPVTALRRE